MKASEIQKIHSALTGVRNKKLPIKLSFILARNLKKMDGVVQDLEEKKQELIEKYGERDEDGELIVGDNGDVKIPHAKAFVIEMSDMLSAEIEMQLDTITESDIEKCEQDGYDNLTVEEVGAMECMINELQGD